MIYRMFLYIFQDDYSHYGIQEFSNQFRKQGGCLAFHLTIPKSPRATDVQEMAERLHSSTAKVVVVFASEVQLLDLFLEVKISVNVYVNDNMQCLNK